MGANKQPMKKKRETIHVSIHSIIIIINTTIEQNYNNVILNKPLLSIILFMTMLYTHQTPILIYLPNLS